MGGGGGEGVDYALVKRRGGWGVMEIAPRQVMFGQLSSPSPHSCVDFLSLCVSIHPPHPSTPP